MDLTSLQHTLSGLKHYPIEEWHPPFCGSIPIHIHRDGAWLYQGSPINRLELVRLFAAILSYQQGRYLLTTPAEQVEISVDDAPFVLVDHRWVYGSTPTPTLQVTSSVGENYLISAELPVLLQPEPASLELLPYLQLPRGLTAKFGRHLYYALVEEALNQPQTRAGELWLRSGETEFCLGHFAED